MLEAAESPASRTRPGSTTATSRRWRSPRRCWRRAARRARPSALPPGLPNGRRTTPLVGRRRRGPRLLAPRRHAPVPRRRAESVAGMTSKLVSDVDDASSRCSSSPQGRRRAGGVARRDRLEGSPSVRAQRRDGDLGHGGPEPAARLLHRGRARRPRRLPRRPRHQHPFLAEWWPPGHVLGWEHSFVHEWRDFLEAVLEERAYPTDRRASRTDTARPSCARRSTSARETRRDRGCTRSDPSVNGERTTTTKGSVGGAGTA